MKGFMEQDKYSEATDEQLIEMLRSGQSQVTDYLLNKYKNLVRKRANALYLIGAETEDLIQEGMIGLFKAIQDYREDKHTSFYHFAQICIVRQMYTAVEASQRKKHSPLNTYISLDEGQDGEGLCFDSENQFHMQDPEAVFISQETVQQLLQRANERLSQMEKQVLTFYLDGMNYRQIAEHMGKPEKSIDNALQRIRGKLTGILEEWG